MKEYEIAAWRDGMRLKINYNNMTNSAFGTIAVHQALRHLNYNELPEEKRGGPAYIL